jgi:ectoine hydroxylase-related dioxygenase (phytanoyl-CoA dioxygenase family)
VTDSLLNERFLSGIVDASMYERYREDGFLIVSDVISNEQAKNFLSEIKKFADEDFSAIMNPDRIDFLIAQNIQKFDQIELLKDRVSFCEQCRRMSKEVWTLIGNKKAIGILEHLQDCSVSYLMSQMLFKELGTKYAKQAWNAHQDNAYPRNETPNSSNGLNTQYITTNFFLENATQENGSLYVYPGSHNLGLLPSVPKVSYREKDNDNPGNEINQETLSTLKKLDLEFKIGDMLVLNGNVVHGSYPNNSKKYSRPLLSVSYISSGEKFIPGNNAQRTEIPLTID